jgi:catalase
LTEPLESQSVEALGNDGYAVHFATEVYKHLKAVAAFGAGIDLLRKAGVDQPLANSHEVVTSAGVGSTTAAEDSVPKQFFGDFASALATHRAWDRDTDSVSA